jgi:hypothetical protein
LRAVPREEIVGSERGALSEDRAVVDLSIMLPRMMGYITIPHFTPKNFSTITSSTKIQIGRCDHVREHDNYLDEDIKTVSAQQAETFETL